MLIDSFKLTPEVFSGRIVRIGQKTMFVAGNYTGGFLGDGSSIAGTYVTPADPDFKFYDRALGEKQEAMVEGLVLSD